MRKNPFSIYDFLGFVFPGALALFLIYLQVETPDAVRLSDYYRAIVAMDFPFTLEETIMLTITAYITGHLIAYLSSTTIEKFSVWVYDYPSKYLLGRVPKWQFWRPFHQYVQEYQRVRHQRQVSAGDVIRYAFSRRHRRQSFNTITGLLCRVTFSLFLFPITLGTLFFSKMLGFKEYLIKPLDDDLRSAVLTHINTLQKYLQVRLGHRSDSHRIIYHYEYERMGAHAIKMDNYVALYGFLRATTFIFNTLFMWLLITTAIPTIDCSAAMDWHLVLLLFSVGTLAYIFFLAFMKFYRRFTLESFMCLMADTSYYIQTATSIRPLRSRRNGNDSAYDEPQSHTSTDQTGEIPSAEREPAEIETIVNGGEG